MLAARFPVILEMTTEGQAAIVNAMEDYAQTLNIGTADKLSLTLKGHVDAAEARALAAEQQLAAAVEVVRQAEKHFGPFADITINGQHDPDDVRVVGLLRAFIASIKESK